MSSRPSPLSALLTALNRALDLDKGLAAHRVVEVWPEIAGPSVAQHAWAHAVQGDTLEVRTDSPVWAHQLKMLEPELVAKIRATLGPDCPVKHIRFRSGSRNRTSCDLEGNESARAGGLRGAGSRRNLVEEGPYAAAARAAAAREAAEHVGDAELAKALEKALRAQDRPE